MMKFLEPLKRRVHLMISRAVLSALVDTSGRQFVQISALKGETKDNVERIQQYGMTSHPHTGAQAILLCVGGNRAHPVVIAVDDPRYRHKSLESGEVCLYTDEGDTIILKRNRTIEINTQNLVVKASSKARFETPLLEVTGEIKDRSDNGGKSMHEMRAAYDSHTHHENGSNTNPPTQTMGG